jgi:hypothetical protein
MSANDVAPNKNMLSGMESLLTVSGDEFAEVIKLTPEGTYKNYRVLVSKLRAVSNAYEFAVQNGFQGTLTQWLNCTEALYTLDASVRGMVFVADDNGIGQWTEVGIGIIDGLQEELDDVLRRTSASAAAASASAAAAQQALVQATGAATSATAAKLAAINASGAASGYASQAAAAAVETEADRVVVVTTRDEVAVIAASIEEAKTEVDADKDAAALSASAALLSEQHAATSATTATTAATLAGAARDTAVTLAAEIEASVDLAIDAKNTAVTSAAAAQTAALEAAAARDAAEAVVVDVTDAVAEVQGYVTEAEAARDAAQATVAVVVTAKDQAVAAATAAETAKDNTVVLVSSAQVAATTAESAKNAAEASALQSTTARDSAEGFAVDALAAVGETQNLVLLADAAKDAAELSAAQATTAKEATDVAVIAAQGSATQATTARDASEAFAANALSAVDEAQARVLEAQLAASEAKATEIQVTELSETTAGYRDQSLAARDDAEANSITALAAAADAQASKLLAQAAVPAAADAAQAEVDAFKQLLVATGVTPGATVVTTIQGGDNAVSRSIQDKLLEQAISVADFKLSAEGSNIRPALVRAIKAIKENKTKSRVLLIPYTVGEWTVDSQVLFDISDFTLLLYGNVRLTATTRQKTFLFSSDIINVPAAALKNVAVFGNGSYVNGNADQMTFTYAHGDGSDNDSAVRFSYIDNLRVYNVWADNGPIDSFSTMRCRNQLIDGCKFTRSKEDNGFSATTDWGPVWEYGNFDTYSYGVVSNCVAEDNQDFGMTAYNASGVYFLNNRSQRNRAGYSYEDSYGAPDTKKYDGGFFGCWAWNCKEQGFYIDADGITIDPNCKSWNIRYIGSNPNGLFGNGVVIANVASARVEGEHTACGHAGLAIFNGTGNLIRVHAKGKFNDNDASGIFGRGVSFLHIEPGTEVRSNGKVQVNAQYNYGVNISNSGGANYLQGAGLVKVDGAIISGNGLGAVDINYVNLVDIHNVIGVDNGQSGSSLAIRVQNATTARVFDNHMESITGNQTFVVDIEATVQNGYEGGNTGTGTTGLVVNNATVKRQSMRAQYYGSFTYDAPSIAAGSQVAPSFSVLGAEVGDFVQVSFSTDIGLISVNAFVVTTGNVLVYLRNNTASAIDLPSMSVRVLVTKRNGG